MISQASKTKSQKCKENGIESERYSFKSEVREKKRRELNLGDKFVVGHVGRFMQQKNHIFLIDIFNEIHKVNPNSELILISDGDDNKINHHYRHHYISPI